MKKIKIALFLLSVSLISCNDYTDLGPNPNQLNADLATPDQYLSAAQTLSYSTQASTMERLGLLFSNACGGNVQSYAAPFNDEFSMNVTSIFYKSIWENLYLRAGVYQKVIDYNDVNSEYKEFKAIAMIGKVYDMEYIVDLYGDAPYTEAFKGINNITPKYDDDFEIYKKLFTELDNARALIDDIAAGTYPNSTAKSNSYDMIFGGSMASWKTFANTIELKMLLRMSKCTGAAGTYRDQRLASMVANGNNNFISTDVTIQPGFSDSRNDTVNPLVYNFGWDMNANPTNYNVYAASGHFIKCLNPYTNVNYASASEQEIVAGSGINYPNVNDPRRLSIFTSPNGQRGVTQGSVFVDVFKPGGSTTGQPSKLAGYFFNPYNQTGTGATNPTLSTGNIFAGNKGYVMTVAESYFLQAEAAHLGSVNPSFAALGLNAASSFAAGVNASMSFYNATPGTYLTTINAKPNFGYNSTFTFSENYNAIMYQKWIAILPSNAIESYIDNTRTGYPLNPMPKNSSYTKRPNRLIYPSSEYISNSANVPNVGLGDIFSVNSKSPFWLQ
ncbi:SusD/RagB family nutrient-binding outer membrane lipoprotein [Flavobacterium aciduliphilum]|uniref:SusD-like starch-binding protein associating with outer membrane n=1 Tax=Flavobacterium aciduliphilum TaxID=1101402 RepID=A0A328Y7Q2_9FLAO|nr:SusD/RagB family nutrient-binding outer membrane lipoprotein [Flavobacterium aciduliphilum]RAR69313.1 SusD-like starch-binding protein associating with outer membrane [Flavobacterium aciduliphilum]